MKTYTGQMRHSSWVNVSKEFREHIEGNAKKHDAFFDKKDNGSPNKRYDGSLDSIWWRR